MCVDDLSDIISFHKCGLEIPAIVLSHLSEYYANDKILGVDFDTSWYDILISEKGCFTVWLLWKGLIFKLGLEGLSILTDEGEINGMLIDRRIELYVLLLCL